MRATSAKELTSNGVSLVAGIEHSRPTMSWAKPADVLPESKAFWATPVRGLTVIMPDHLEDVSQVMTSSRKVVIYNESTPPLIVGQAGSCTMRPEDYDFGLCPF